MRIQDVIRRPLITEKSTRAARDAQRRSPSRCDRDANKIEVKQAVEAQFKVKVAEVRIARVHGKVRRQGRFAGQRPDWKKAYVRLRRGREADRVLRGRCETMAIMGIKQIRPINTLEPVPDVPDVRRAHDRPAAEVADRAARSRPAAATTRATSPAGAAAAATSGATARSTSGATSTASRPRSRRSSTTRTARRASRCCTTPTARSATSSRRSASRSATRWRRGEAAEVNVGNALPLRRIPLGTMIHNIELKLGKGGQMVRSAGAGAQLMAREGDYAQVKLPSGEVRQVHVECYATIGQVGNLEHENVSIGKAGRKRWLGKQAAQPRRVDEPGRPPDGRRRGQDLRRPPSRARRGACRPRATRPATTSAPTA